MKITINWSWFLVKMLVTLYFIEFLEEVFNAAEALWFSPNGTYLAVASFNDTFVESAVYPYYGNSSDTYYQYPELVQFKYPKVSATLIQFLKGYVYTETWLALKSPSAKKQTD